MERKITYGEIIGAVETKTVYNNTKKSVRGIYVINKHLDDAREFSISKTDETIEADKFKLAVDEKYQPEINKMNCEHNELLLDKLEDINITKHKI